MAKLATGITVSFATSSWSAEITAINYDGRERPVFNVPHQGSTGEVPKLHGNLVDRGTVSFDIYTDWDSPPPEGAAPEQITITYPLPSGQVTPGNDQFTGAVVTVTENNEVENPATATVTVSCEGWTRTPSAGT